jgi:hypothetical protein
MTISIKSSEYLSEIETGKTDRGNKADRGEGETERERTRERGSSIGGERKVA